MGKIAKTLLVVPLVLLTGCVSTRQSGGRLVGAEPPLLSKDQEWHLVEFQGRKVERGSSPVTIIFNSESGTLRGQAACNSYAATYKLETPQSNPKAQVEWCPLTVSGMTRTSVQCPDSEMNAEARYLSRVAKCTQLALAEGGNTLLLGNKDKTVMVFELK